MVWLAIATMMRPRSDLGSLQFRDTHIIYDKNNEVIGATLIYREPKEQQWKTPKLGALDPKSKEKCPVKLLDLFLQRTKPLRDDLDEDRALFLAFIEDDNKRRPIQPGTATSWIQAVMTGAGIDTEVYKAHSIRSAASTWAVKHGHKVDQTKDHANWSRNSDTFKKYYYKPLTRFKESTEIASTIFSVMEKSTASSEPSTLATD